MDEGLLNDLLECSVCLERLDTSSRVLPCQHTFCLKCLKVIVESHKELRCPECRILVETKVEELPPNVLLMRILEGMKNSAPRKVMSTAQRTPRGGILQGQLLSGQHSVRSDGKQLPPHARALYDYISKEMGDLSFKKGETILLQKKLDAFWYQGECSGRTGMFPITFVHIMVPLPVPTALCKALYDFRMSAPDEEGCLAFDKGAIIAVHRRVDENWAEGRLDQRVGIFPIAFVELNQAARHLMNSVSLNRAVPSVPEQARAGQSEHRHHTQQSHRYQPMSMSTPPSIQGNYQNMATMAQSHPNFVHPILPQSQLLTPHQQISTITHGSLLTTASIPRSILEPTQTKSLDLIQFNHKSSSGMLGVQSVPRIGENYERLRTIKYENNTPIHKGETTYQNIRTEHFPTSVVNFNANNSSDSSSSVNTPSVGVSSTTTPNTSSNNSTCESAEPSLPSSPDNNTDRNSTVVAPNTSQNESNNEPAQDSLNTSMGVLSLNESSTATNTSLNVSLPTENSALNTSVPSNQSEVQENAGNNEQRDGQPMSSYVGRSSGPDSILNFGLGLQAALSPCHGKESNYASRGHREHHRDREKRHSLTPTTHLQGNHSSQNRLSAEILATSLLDHTPERDRERDRPERNRERRRRRSRSNERPLPASYIALYPYKPQKSDELELKKGGIYTVTERCRDGWYKGWSERSQRAGVFPGNYVAPTHATKHEKNASPACASVKPTQAVVIPAIATLAPPDAPPRAHSPLPSTAQSTVYPWSTAHPQQSTPKSEKVKEKTKSDKSSISSGVSLMKRLAAMKKCKSPPPTGYSMDNPVFEDGPGTSLMLNVPEQHHPVHVRNTNEGPWQSQHRKSQSLDVTATRRDRHHSQPVKERFRCIVPYPPNSEYELELKVDDIVIVSKKRGDGWYKGTLQRTGRTGLFPASFVQSCPQE